MRGAVHLRPWSELAQVRIGVQERPLSALSDVAGAALDRIHVTCARAVQLAQVRDDIVGCLLIPPTPSRAGLDLVVHDAVQRAWLVDADAVHLQPSQLDAETVAQLNDASLDVHVWDADDLDEVRRLAGLGLSRFCTNRLDALLALRDELG